LEKLKDPSLIDKKDENEDDPIWLAFLRGIEEIIQLLMPKCSLEFEDCKGHSPLLLACERGLSNVVRMIIGTSEKSKKRKRSESNEQIKQVVNSMNKYKTSALMIACDYGHSEIVRLLIENGANVNHENIKLETALYFAATNGHLEIVKMLVNAGANLNSNKNLEYYLYNSRSIFPFKGFINMVENEELNKYSKNHYNRCAILAAFFNGYPEICDFLEQNGAKLNCHKTKELIEISFEMGFPQNIRWLINKKFDFENSEYKSTIKSIFKKSAIACQYNNEILDYYEIKMKEIAKMIQNEFFLRLKEKFQTYDADDFLQELVHVIDKDDSEYFIINSYHIFEDILKPSELHHSHKYISTDTLKCFLSNEFNQKYKKFYLDFLVEQQQLINKASEEIKTQFSQVSTLTSNNDVLEREYDGLKYEQIESIIQKNELLNKIYSLKKQTNVDYILSKIENYVRKIGKFITNSKCFSEILLQFQRFENENQMVSSNEDLPETEHMSRNCLLVATKRNRPILVEYFIKKGIDINARDNKGDTALLIASKEYCYSAGSVLINNGANVDEKDMDGLAPLHIIHEFDYESDLSSLQIEHFELLIEKGADVNIQDNDENTPLHLAIKNENDEFAEMLIYNEADLNSINEDGMDPIYLAINKGNTYIFEALINKGVVVVGDNIKSSCFIP